MTKANKGFWVWLRWTKDAPKNAWEKWTDWKNAEIWSTTGDWDCKIWVPEESLKGADIQSHVWELKKNSWVAATKTEWSWQVQ